MKRKPAFIIREGSVIVRAYRYKASNRYCLYYRKRAGAAASRETKTGETAARVRAREIAIALANGRAEILELTNADRDSYLHAKSLLPDGFPLHEAIEGFLQLRSKLTASAPIGEIFAKFIRAKETMLRNGELSEVHVKKLREDLTKFVEDFPKSIGDYFTDDLQDWLNSRCDKKANPIGPRRRRHIRDRVVSLYNFARDNGYLPLNERHAAEKTARPRVLKDKEPTFEPQQFDLLINSAHRDDKQHHIVPALALAAFGRLRMSEISRLDWSSIYLEKSEIDVSSRVAGKTGNARIIEIPLNLSKWLKPYLRASGPVLDSKIGRIDNRVRRFSQKIGLKWQRNILRGSCASYLYALTNDLKYVAAQLGTSERTLRREYLERKTREQAERWYAIAPDQHCNVLELRWSVSQ
jgi:integrase